MKKELTYSEAFSKLEDIVARIEDGHIQLDELSASVQQANKFISICENKLRSIEQEIKDATNN